MRRVVIPVVVTALVAALAVVLGPVGPAAAVVESPLTLGYDKQVYGDFMMAGNAVTVCPPTTPACTSASTRANNTANDSYYMTQTGAINGWFNSSSVRLTIPSGARIDYAQLVWGGDTGLFRNSASSTDNPRCASTNSPVAVSPSGSPATTPVRLTVGSNAAASVNPARLTTDKLTNLPNGSPQFYSAAANVTSSFINAPTGSPLTITAANVWAPAGFGCFGGWSIILVYAYDQANPAHAPNKREVFLYDGHVRQSSSDADTTTTITGFRANGQAEVGTVAYEGDWGISNDQFLINGTAQTDPGGPGGSNTNFFTSYAQNDDPNAPVNNFAVDAKQFLVSTNVIKTGDTSANLTFHTSGDTYLAEELVLSVPVPELTITKTVSPSIVHPGDALTWTITVTNSSSATAKNVAVTDALVPSCARVIGVIAGGGTTTYTCTSAAPSSSGQVTNTANVTGTDTFNSPLTGTATASVLVLAPAIKITKMTNQTTYHVGDTVTYTITVENTGNAALTGVAVTDPTTAGCARTIGALAAGDSTSYTCTATAPVPSNANTANVSGTDQLNRTVTSTSTVPVPVIHPGLTLVKSAAPTTVTAAGQTVTYSFKVTNTGDAAVTGLSIADTPTAPAGPAPVITCPTTSLAVGASTTCTGPYTVTQADIDNGTIGNSAVADAKDPLNTTVSSGPSTSTVAVTRAPQLQLTKSATPTTVSTVGATVAYAFVVTNTGNVTVRNIAINDTFTPPAGPVPTINCPSTTLRPGESTRCTASYTASQADFDHGSITNSATASGTGPTGATVTSPVSTASVTASTAPSISLVKTATPTTINAEGQVVSYSFKVTNTGNQTLHSLTVADTLASPAGPEVTVSCPTTTLTPGATTTCTASYTATQADVDHGSIKNSAVARGIDPGGNPVTSAESTATVGVAQSPALNLSKAAAPTTITASGQTVSYAFAVTNTGNVTITNLAIADSFTAPAGPVPAISCPTTTLAPGATTSCTATYTATQADVDTGSIKNSATAHGTDPTDNTVVSPASAATVTVTRSTGLSLTKSAAPTTVSAVGQDVLYSFKVTNIGNQTLTGVSVADSLDAPAGPPLTINCPATTLAPGATTTCTATYRVLQSDLDAGSVTNNATARATDQQNATVTSNPSAATVTASTTAALTVVKTASPSTISEPGVGITYSFRVTNNGTTTISGIVVDDPKFPGGDAPACPVTTLAPGTATTCTATYTSTQADVNAGSIHNTATASGKDPMNTTVTSAPSTATVTVDQSPALALVKSAAPARVSAAGDQVTYTFTVTNAGNVTITGVAVADTFTAPAGPPLSGITCMATTLAPDASTTCTATYTATQADLDAGSINNSAVATGKDPGNATVSSNTSTASVSSVAVPRLTLAKTASPTTVSAAGDQVTYTFAVTNSGNVTISGVAVADTFTAPAGPVPAINCPATTLTPGTTTDCTATYDVTQADVDAGSIRNSAIASGKDPANTTIASNSAHATVDVAREPHLTIAKSADPTTIFEAGDPISYSFVVTNTGNVTVSGVVVADTFASPAGPEITPSCPTTSLAPGASTTCTAGYTASQADVNNGSIKNSATATGKDPAGNGVTSAPATATVTVTQTAGLSVVKAADPTTVTAAGQTVNYTFTATNTGNVTLTQLHVLDSLNAPAAPPITITCPRTTVGPGAVVVCTGSYTVTQADIDAGSIDNTGTAEAISPDGTTITSSPSTATVSVTRTPQLQLTKSAEPASVDASGETVAYTFSVTNTGNVTVHGLAIADVLAPPAGPQLSAITCSDTVLAPAATATCTASYSATQADLDHGSIDNTATASALGPAGTSVTSNPSTATVATAAAPALTVTKAAAPTSITAAGQQITYTVTVHNTGNVTVGDIAVSDPMFPGAAAPACATGILAPDATTTCTATYTATQADVDRGSIVNTATAGGTAPDGAPVSSPPASATVNVLREPALTVVKSALPTSVSAAGATVDYRFVVTNTGNVTLHAVAVADRFSAPAGPSPVVTCPATTLAPDETVTCTASYTATQADIDDGTIDNVATATALDPFDAPVASAPSAVVVTAPKSPSMSLVKTAGAPSVSHPGQTIGYSFTATNTGNVTLRLLAILDTLTAPAGPPLSVTCPDRTLLPTEQASCNASYTVTQEDLDHGSVDNVARAEAQDPDGVTIFSAQSAATVPVTAQPALTLHKTAAPATLTAAGQSVTYTFEVTNSGNVTVSGIAVADPMFPGAAAPNCAATTLAPSATTTCTATYVSTQADIDQGQIANTATATGQTAGGGEVESPPASALVTVTQAPALRLVKSALIGLVTSVGEGITYNFDVTNTGNVTVTDLAVDDVFTAPAGPAPDVTCSATTLAPTNSTSCTVTYLSTQADFDTGSIANTATAHGTGPGGADVDSNPSSVLVTAAQNPALTLVKSASPTTVESLGQQVVFTFGVTNTGTTTVHALTIADTFAAPAAPELAPDCLATTLASGEHTTCTATYTVNQADLDAASITNSAVADALDPADAAVASPPSTATVAVSAAAALSVTKSASPTTVTRAGDVVTYSFAVTNTGTLTVHGIAVDDPLLTGASAPTCEDTTLAPTASTTCTATYAVTQADIDRGTVHNTATATGRDPAGAPVASPPSSADVTATANPAVTIVKSATTDGPITGAGQDIDYQFVVHNTGNVTLTELAVDDTFAAPAGPPLTLDCPGSTLGPDESMTCTATYSTNQADADAGSVNNAATVTGTGPDGYPVTSEPSTASVPIAPGPALTLTKSVDPVSSAVGATVEYRFLVTNTGNVTVSALTIDDTLTDPAGPALNVRCPETSLAPAEATTCTAAYRIKQGDGDAGLVENTATAMGRSPDGASVTSNESSATVTVPAAPALTLDKSASPTSVSAVGDEVSYRFLVTNSGNVTVHGLSIADALTAPAGPPLTVDCPATTLAPTASTTCTATYSATQADLDAGAIENSATAAALSPAGVDVTSDPSAAVVTVATDPALTLVKSAAPQTVTGAGQTVTYQFLVTNTGNVTVHGLNVDDTLAAPAGPALSVDCPVTTLAPTDATTCSATYTVTQDDIDSALIGNTATADAQDPANGTVTSPPSTATVAVAQTSGLTLTKTADPSTVTAAGQTVTYSFLVHNTGNVTVRDLSIADALAAPASPALVASCPVTTLAPDASTTCTGSYLVTQPDIDHGAIDNSATASGTGPAGGTITSDPATAHVTAPRTSALTVAKSADPSTVTAAGDVVTYTFLVTNTGNTTVRSVHIDDTFTAPAGPAPAVTCASTRLVPLATTTCTSTYPVTQDDADHGTIHNAATAAGTDPVGDPVTSPPSAADVTVAQVASLELVKTSSVGTVSTIGQSVTYRFLVTNTGNVTVTDLAVADVFTAPAGPEISPQCPATTLAPGRQTTCTADYPVTTADLDHGSINNTATATATAPDASAVTSPPSSVTITTVAQPSIALVKHASANDVDSDGVLEPGDTVTWTFTVTNTGNVSLDPVHIADAKAGPVTCPSAPLGAGDNALCTADGPYVITQADADAGHVDNTATAQGTDPFGTTVTSDPSGTSTVIPPVPSIALVKAAELVDVDDNGVPDLGDGIQWSFELTNTGNVTLTVLTVEDPIAGAVTCPTAPLASGASATCRADAAHRISQQDVDAGHVDNTATVSGTDPNATVVTSEPSSTSTGIGSEPGLVLVKRATIVDANDSGRTDAGDEIRWTFLVTNSGNVTLTGLAISDPAAGQVTCPATSLAPEESITCAADDARTLSQEDVDSGSVSNTASATGIDPGGDPVISGPSTVRVVLPPMPALLLTKRAIVTDADDNGATGAGDRVVWTFQITNTGNVTITGIVVHDPTAGAITCPRRTLAPGAHETCRSAAHTITAAEAGAGELTNTATVSGSGPAGHTVTSSPSIAAVTMSSSGSAPSGAGRPAETGAKYLPELVWFSGSALLLGILLTFAGLVRRRRGGLT